MICNGLKAAWLAAALLTTTLVPVSAFAADEVNMSRGIGDKSAGVGFHSYDLVSMFSGSPALGVDEHAVVHDGVTYRFASAENASAFKASPAKYLPQFGGFCAFAVGLGRKYDGDPRHWKVVNGKLYVIYNATFLKEWEKDIAGNVSKSDANWTKIRTVAVDKL